MPSVNEVFAGFPCTDVSNLNVHRRSNANSATISDGSLSTGACFHSILRYCDGHDVDLLILENVRGLRRQLRTCKKLLAAKGYVSCVFLISPIVFGVPQSRPRFWFACARKRLIKNEAAFVRECEDAMQRFAGHSLTPLDSYLLSDSDPLVNCVLDRSDRSDRPDHRCRSVPCGSSSSMPLWVSRHIAMCELRGRSWSSVTDCVCGDMLRLFPGLGALVPREIDGLGTLGISCPDTRPDCPLVVDVSQGFDRANIGNLSGGSRASEEDSLQIRSAISPCVTPRSRLYHTRRGRLLVGYELLRLQGIVFSDQELDRRLRTVTNELCHDLAGNAFNTQTCLAVYLALIIAVDQHVG